MPARMRLALSRGRAVLGLQSPYGPAFNAVTRHRLAEMPNAFLTCNWKILAEINSRTPDFPPCVSKLNSTR